MSDARPGDGDDANQRATMTGTGMGALVTTVGSMVIAASLMPPFHARIVVVHSSRRQRRGAGKPMLQVEVLDVGRGHLIDQK